MIPIEVPVDREEVILCGWVGDVTRKCVDIGFVSCKPARIKVPDHGSRIDEVSIMEVMIVVVSISEISASIACDIGSV